jgi:hypothetical protein
VYDGTVGLYVGTVGVYDGTVGVYIGGSFSSATIPGVIFLPAPARLCRRVKASDGFSTVCVCVQEFSERDDGVHVPWDPEVSSASDGTRRREVKHSTTKPVLLALTAIVPAVSAAVVCGWSVGVGRASLTRLFIRSFGVSYGTSLPIHAGKSSVC